MSSTNQHNPPYIYLYWGIKKQRYLHTLVLLCLFSSSPLLFHVTEVQFPPYPNGINKARLKGKAISCMRCTNRAGKNKRRPALSSQAFSSVSDLRKNLFAQKQVWFALLPFFYPIKDITLKALPHSCLLRQKMLFEHLSRYKTAKYSLHYHLFRLHLIFFTRFPSYLRPVQTAQFSCPSLVLFSPS